MKRIIFVLGLVILIAGLSAQDQQQEPAVPLELQKELAFGVGEKLHYKVRYGLLNAGKIELEVESATTVNEQELLHIVGRGWSVGMTEWFFKVRDRYETYFDTELMAPTEFIRDVDEGGYTIKRHVLFDHEAGTATDLEAPEKGPFTIPTGVQDVFSTLYYARSFDLSDIQEGDVIDLSMFLDHKLYPFQLKYLGDEVLKTDFGKLNCKTFMPRLQEGRIFKDEEGMTVWVSDDQNHLPVLLQTSLLIGNLKAELTHFDNLKYPLNLQK